LFKVERETFSGEDLAGVHPSNAWFDRCDFGRADLRGASMRDG